MNSCAMNRGVQAAISIVMILFVSFGLGTDVAVAQEFDPRDPSVIAMGVNRAQLIVVGTFRVNRSSPWFDGWRYSGELQVQEVLDGERMKSIPFHWTERYGGTCLVCETLSALNNENGIWMLTRSVANGWKLIGATGTFCGGPFPLGTKELVAGLVQKRRERQAREHQGGANRYFPSRSIDDFRYEWYSAALRSMDEASLWTASGSPSTAVFRFLWLRSFHQPVLVRLNVEPDGSGTLNLKILSGAYPPGRLVTNRTKAVPSTTIGEFRGLLGAARYWSLTNELFNFGEDGSQWIMEAVEIGRYNVVDRWSPLPSDKYRMACWYLVQLAGLDIPTNQIY